jgi:hypothetical protein
MAITDLASLRTRFLDWADNNDITDEAANEFVQFATHTFNYGSADIAPLRTRDMVATVSLTPSSSVATLPDDYLQFRSVTLNTASPRLLSYVSPDDAVSLYGNNWAGLSNSFTVVGNQLTLYPANSSNVSLVYYQKIPELEADADTNWVLEKHSNLYLHTALYHLGIYRKDNDQIQTHASMARAVMEGIAASDVVGTFGYAPMRPRGMVIA